MKLIGVLGGMSWESTTEYYRLLNQGVRAHRGGHHSARILMHSVDFAEIEAAQHRGDWQATANILIEAAVGLKKAGADFLVIATNTMHKVAPEVEQESGLKVLHIADATADALIAQGITQVGLLGTRFTMEQDFYRERLEARGIKVLTPETQERETVHRVIYDELCQGIIRDESRLEYQSICDTLKYRGAEGVILGCTEIGLLLNQQGVTVPLFDTTAIHAEAAVSLALAET